MSNCLLERFYSIGTWNTWDKVEQQHSNRWWPQAGNQEVVVGEIEQELPEISSSSLSPESKDKIKTLLNKIGDIVVVEDEKNGEEKENGEGNYL